MPYSFGGGCYLHLQVRRYHSHWLALKPIPFSPFSVSLTVLSCAAYYPKHGGTRRYKYLSLQEVQIRFLFRLALSLVSILTELGRLFKCLSR
jgi:hypothetical protein